MRSILLFAVASLAAQVDISITDNSVGGWHVFPPGAVFSVQVRVACSGCGTITGVWKDENDVTLSSAGTFAPGIIKTATSPSGQIGHYELTFSSSSNTDTINERPAGYDKRFGFPILPVPPAPTPRTFQADNPFGMVHLSLESNGTYDPYFLGGYIKTLTWDVTSANWWSYEGDRRRVRNLQDVPLLIGPPWSDSPINPSGIQSKIQPYFAGDPLMTYYECGLEENLGSAFRQAGYFNDLAAKTQAVRDAATAAGVPGIQLGYQVVGTDLAGDIQDVINSVALAKFQFLSLHPYRWNEFEDPSGWMGTLITSTRTALNAVGRSDMDIWFSEIGTPINTNPGGNYGYPPDYTSKVTGITRQREADYLTKTHVISFANGVKKVFWYHYQDGGNDITYAEDNFGLVDYWGYKQPAYTTYMRLLAALHNKTIKGTPRTNYGTNSVWSYEFEDSAGESVIVAWIYPDPGTAKSVPLTDLKAGLSSSGVAKVTTNVGTPSLLSGGNLMLGTRPMFVFLGTSPDPCQGNTCSGHGVCSSPAGVATCTCTAGWEGPTCNVVSNCPVDQGWPSTTPGVTALKTCGSGMTGNNTRQCSLSGTWGIEVNTCVASPNCTDGIMNQDETGVDCGGKTCKACANCPTINCGVHGTCVEGSPPNCTCNSSYTGDRCQNAPDPCLGQTCSNHGTCSLGVCTCTGGFTGTLCQNPPNATCLDGIQNQNETGVDCGGPCPACPTYSWSYGNWTVCSVSCGGGTETRTATCVSSPGNMPAVATFCNSLHPPITQQICNPDTCPTYRWQAGSWGVCTTECGGGQQTRSVTCISSLGNVMVTPGNSTCPLIDMPISSQLCNTAACVAPRWVAGNWSNCSRLCGGGLQTRSVSCQAPNDTVVASSLCTPPAPATEQACNLQTCNVYTWQPCKQWSTCSAACGGGDGMLGQQWREVFCVDQSGNVVDTTLCDQAIKPLDTSTVCNTQRCTNYNWMVSAPGWGPCLNNVRARSFHCHAPDGTLALASQCTQFAGPMPITSVACLPNTCLTRDCPNAEIDQVFLVCLGTDFGSEPTCSPLCTAALGALLATGKAYTTAELQLCIETYSGPTNAGLSTQMVSASLPNPRCATSVMSAAPSLALLPIAIATTAAALLA